MESRNQYLKEVRIEYLKTKSKKRRGELLDEAEKRTVLGRKHLVKKLRPKSNLDKLESEKKKRPSYYDNAIKPALVTMWKIFDHPCGQRLEPLLKSETEKLRELHELSCSDTVAKKLQEIGSATIDRKLKHTKIIELAKKKYGRKIHPLLYQKIPVKVFAEQNRSILGHMQIDLVEHCGGSAAGQFVCTLTGTDGLSGWTEEEAVWGRGQENTKDGLDRERERCPFAWIEIHSDGGTEFINAHLYAYSQDTSLEFSRSRPYKKNDNCLVEQKNWTHVRKLVGYLRYDTMEEMDLLNSLYADTRLFKNFFQPVIKLLSKERVGGKLHRKYDKARTPYQRIMMSVEVSKDKKKELEKIYSSLNPAALKRQIDKKLNLLYKTYQEKINSQKVEGKKKISVIFSKVRRIPVSV